jgi:hypothetical protein
LADPAAGARTSANGPCEPVINPAFETFAEHFGIDGLVGVRAITHYAGRFFSPVYGYC